MAGSSNYEQSDSNTGDNRSASAPVTTTLAAFDGVETRTVPPHRALGVDCGCWLGHQHNLGIILGKEVAVISVEVTNRGSKKGNLKQIPALLKKVAQDTGLFLNIIHSGSISPYFSNEEPAEWCATSTNFTDAIIFVPDLHIGLRDAADDFYLGQLAAITPIPACVAPGASPEPEEDPGEFNLNLLLRVLSAFKNYVTRIVQLGDFLDIWEAEEFTYEVEHHWWLKQMDPFVASSDITRASHIRNVALSGRAEMEVRRRWGKKLSDLESLFTHRIRGNHDFDGGIKNDCWHFPVTASEPASPHMGTDLRVRCEHGHRYDMFNRTFEKLSEPSNNSERAEASFGRNVTWEYAQKERNSNRNAEYGFIASLSSGFSVGEMRSSMNVAICKSLPCLRWSPQYKEKMKTFPRIWVIGHTHEPKIWQISIEEAAWCSKSSL